jgi:glycyl-tRNA synthetase
LSTGVTIGKRYARTDELGVPFAITVDYDTINEGDHKGSVTLRERDTTEQVRVPIPELVPVLRDLCDTQSGDLDWDTMKKKYPIQAAPVDGEA